MNGKYVTFMVFFTNSPPKIYGKETNLIDQNQNSLHKPTNNMKISTNKTNKTGAKCLDIFR